MTEPSTTDLPAVEPIRPAVQAKRGGAWLNVLLGVASLAAVGALAFAAGRMTAPGAAALPGGGTFPGGANFGPRASGAPGGGNFPGGGAVFGPGSVTLEGTVESKTADTLTIKTSDGQTVEVSLAGDTTYHSATTASGDAVQAGSNVKVQVDLQGGAQGQGQGQGPGQGQLSASDVTVVP